MSGDSSKQLAVSSKQLASTSAGLGNRVIVERKELPTAHSSMLTRAGFTLLELMIVISIIIILAAIALPQYQRSITHAKEAVLADDLFKMRSLIDQYAADKGELPRELNDLVTAGYMRDIPVDPFTGNADWQPLPGADPNSTSGEQGIIDVHSSSGDTGSDGRAYSEW